MNNNRGRGGRTYRDAANNTNQRPNSNTHRWPNSHSSSNYAHQGQRPFQRSADSWHQPRYQSNTGRPSSRNSHSTGSYYQWNPNVGELTATHQRLPSPNVNSAQASSSNRPNENNAQNRDPEHTQVNAHWNQNISQENKFAEQVANMAAQLLAPMVQQQQQMMNQVMMSQMNFNNLTQQTASIAHQQPPFSHQLQLLQQSDPRFGTPVVEPGGNTLNALSNPHLLHQGLPADPNVLALLASLHHQNDPTMNQSHVGSLLQTAPGQASVPISNSTQPGSTNTQPQVNYPQWLQLTSPLDQNQMARYRSMAMDDMNRQKRESLYKLKILVDDLHSSSASVAWDKQLLVVHSSIPATETWNFSIRCKKEVTVEKVELNYNAEEGIDFGKCFALKDVKVFGTAADDQDGQHQPITNKRVWTATRDVKFVLVQIDFENNLKQLYLEKYEIALQIYFSDGNIIIKWLQLLKRSKDFESIKSTRESIETYKAPVMAEKGRTVVSEAAILMDNWTRSLDRKYPLKNIEANNYPNVNNLSPESYKEDIHAALYLEEMAQTWALNDISMQANVTLSHSYKDADEIEHSLDGDDIIFASIKCPFSVSEDSIRGEALMDIAHSVLLSRRGAWDSSEYDVKCVWGQIVGRFFKTETDVYSIYKLKRELRTLYVVVKLKKKDLNVIAVGCECDEFMYVQFLLNRSFFLQAHFAVDQMEDPSFLFPAPTALLDENAPPWYFPENASVTVDKKRKMKENREKFMEKFVYVKDLNSRQKEACEACQYRDESQIKKSYPPILITGPFGTGKTHTLAKATKMLLDRKDSTVRILICMVSRNTGNVYHQQLVDGGFSDKCVRLFAQSEDVSHVDLDLLAYSNYKINDDDGSVHFEKPNKMEILKKDVVIVSLSAATLLHQIGLNSSNFTHVFIDEAAQVAEFFLLPILAFASKDNKLCMTGDIMQLNPFLFSNVLCSKFSHSIVQRFSDKVYSDKCAFRFNLDVNYRSQKKILEFVYSHFYGIPYNDQSQSDDPFPNLEPLQFVSVRGNLSSHNRLASNCNWLEADEIAKIVARLLATAPRGYFKHYSIGIVTNTKGQTQAIKDTLEEAGVAMEFVEVDTVLNMQGRQYQVIIISIVIDRKMVIETMTNPHKTQNDLGFLIDPKLTCTAMTRAISLVFVVGDAAAMLLHDRLQCFSLWADYLKVALQVNEFNKESLEDVKFRLNYFRQLVAEKKKEIERKAATQNNGDVQLQQLVHQMNTLKTA